jgi:hypothetical protein
MMGINLMSPSAVVYNGRHEPLTQRAVHELLLRSRELMNETMPTGSVHSDRSDNAAIAHTEQLVLDVRAGRLHIF